MSDRAAARETDRRRWPEHAAAVALLAAAGAANMRVWFTRDLMPPGDFPGYAAVIAYVRDALLHYGRVPSWCSTCFGGTTYFVSSFKEYLAFPFALWFGPLLATKLLFLLMKVLAACGMYLLHARVFRAPLAGVVAGYAYGFGACANHEVEHLDVPVSQAIFPLVYLAATELLREQRVMWAVGLGCLLACQFWNNIVQASVCVIMVALLVAVRPWRQAPPEANPLSDTRLGVRWSALLILALLVFALIAGAQMVWLAADGGNHLLISPIEAAGDRNLYIERSPFLYLNRANWMARWLAEHQPPGLNVVMVDGERRYLGVVALAVCLAGWFFVRGQYSLRRRFQVGILLFLAQYWLALGPRTALWEVARSFGWSDALEARLRITLTVGATACLVGALLLLVRRRVRRQLVWPFRVELLLGLSLLLVLPAYPLFELIREGIPLAGNFLDFQRSPGHYFDLAPFSLYLVFGLSLAAIGEAAGRWAADRQAGRPDSRASRVARRADRARLLRLYGPVPHPSVVKGALGSWASVRKNASSIAVGMIAALVVADFWPSTAAFRQGMPMEWMRRAERILAELPGEGGTLRLVSHGYGPLESWLAMSSQAGRAWSWLPWQAGPYWAAYLRTATWESGQGPGVMLSDGALLAVGRLKYFLVVGEADLRLPSPWMRRTVDGPLTTWEQPAVVPMASGYRSYVLFVGEPDDVALELIAPLYARNTLVISSAARLSEVDPALFEAASFVHLEGERALSDEGSRVLAARDPEKIVDLRQAWERAEALLGRWQDEPLVPVVYERPTPEHIVLRVDAGDGPAMVFVSEGYHPWWQATMDGEAAPVVRAQMAFMAIPVSAGTHVVDLRLERPPLVAAADALSVVSTTALALGALGLRLAAAASVRLREL